jgi:poly-beta-1,6-N-acetyl-D-glucosamine biosynthesis protein PgaD
MSPAPQRKPWPPLIQTALPAWMKWRDALLTLLMWSLFAFMLLRQFRLVSRTVAGRTDVVEFLALLAPYAGLAVLLIGVLAVAARLTERRREKALRLRPPAPLGLADEARGVGLDEAALEQARALRVAVVNLEPGGLRIQRG